MEGLSEAFVIPDRVVVGLDGVDRVSEQVADGNRYSTEDLMIDLTVVTLGV